MQSEVQGRKRGLLRDEERTLLLGEDRGKERSPAQNTVRGGERGLDFGKERGLEQTL